MSQVIVALLLVLVAICVFIAFRLLRQSKGDAGNSVALREELAALRQKIEGLESDEAELKSTVERLRAELSEKEQELVRAQSGVEHLKSQMAEERERIKEMEAQHQERFKNLSTQVLDAQSKKFSDHSKELLGNLLNPLEKGIIDFRREMNKLHVEDQKQSEALRQALEEANKAQLKLSGDAENLANALKGDNKVAGDWGEIVLERVLQMSGLREGEEYKTQASERDESGSLLRPDVVVNMPSGEDERHVIIDSKLTLSSHVDYCNAEDPAERDKHLKAMIASIKTHIDGVSQKNYQSLYGVKHLDFILVFIPIEPAFNIAISNDPQLYEHAYKKNIVMVTPSTLLAALRTIANLWVQERQNRNVVKIADEAGKLYDKFASHCEDLENVGKNLKTLSGNFDKAMNKLSTGRGSIVGRVENLKALGLKTKKKLPDAVLGELDDHGGGGT